MVTKAKKKKTTPISDSKDQIRAFQKKKAITPYSLALAAGLHRNTLRDMNKTSWNPDSSTIDSCLRYIELCK